MVLIPGERAEHENGIDPWRESQRVRASKVVVFQMENRLKRTFRSIHHHYVCSSSSSSSLDIVMGIIDQLDPNLIVTVRDPEGVIVSGQEPVLFIVLQSRSRE